MIYRTLHGYPREASQKFSPAFFQKAAQSRRVASSLVATSESSFRRSLFASFFSRAFFFERKSGEKPFTKAPVCIHKIVFRCSLTHEAQRKANKRNAVRLRARGWSLLKKLRKTFVTLRVGSREVFDKSQFINPRPRRRIPRGRRRRRLPSEDPCWRPR